MTVFKNWLEAFTIRVLWMFHATRLKRTPGLCPPACQEGHTYRWPCRARIQAAWYAANVKYSHYDKPPLGEYRIRESDEDLANNVMVIESVGIKKCGAKRAGGWGQIAAECIYDRGHDGSHSWVAQ